MSRIRSFFELSPKDTKLVIETRDGIAMGRYSERALKAFAESEPTAELELQRRKELES